MLIIVLILFFLWYLFEINETPVHFAAECGNAEMIDILRQYGANLNALSTEVLFEILKFVLFSSKSNALCLSIRKF